ncbi:Ycf48-like protein [Pseudorhizobium halotolerans]|uniref:Ycf48-like protein n=1 Tax=Pseudorhizobium halotolerans TaxID=1233081 RepID=A0ABM8PXC2_9HYPH|nr:exo-alpha-sialidase [Pseudorhizobium halotolerans]CAD7053628.1 Ycf48-like protein [Pseudorhizobium halotolerans]
MKEFVRMIVAALMTGLVGTATATAPATVAETVSVLELQERTHVHGLAVDRRSPDQLLIATHHGLFRSGPDGQVELVSPVQDFMGFTPDPTDPSRLFASGHPAGGGNLGFIASSDNGVTWQQVAAGVDGPVDFHQMTVSAADPKMIYGAYGALQVTRDAGKTWSIAGPLPQKLIDLAASAASPDTVYAATEGGLLASLDGGQSWQEILAGAPVSLVEVTPDGSLYAFVLGRGLVRSAEADLDFKTVSDSWGDRILLHLAVDRADKSRMFAASHKGAILASTDGGKTWVEFGK